jgi:hypothetical protein
MSKLLKSFKWSSCLRHPWIVALMPLSLNVATCHEMNAEPSSCANEPYTSGGSRGLNSDSLTFNRKPASDYRKPRSKQFEQTQLLKKVTEGLLNEASMSELPGNLNANAQFWGSWLDDASLEHEGCLKQLLHLKLMSKLLNSLKCSSCLRHPANFKLMPPSHDSPLIVSRLRLTSHITVGSGAHELQIQSFA